MALIQAAFARSRDGSSRLMSFQSIAEATRLPVDEVEHLIMKALRSVPTRVLNLEYGYVLMSSLKLIRGSLDQVDSTVDISWVQPRVLEGSQLDTLAAQFEQWSQSVGKTSEAVEAQRVLAKQAVLAQ